MAALAQECDAISNATYFYFGDQHLYGVLGGSR